MRAVPLLVVRMINEELGVNRGIMVLAVLIFVSNSYAQTGTYSRNFKPNCRLIAPKADLSPFEKRDTIEMCN